MKIKHYAAGSLKPEINIGCIFRLLRILQLAACRFIPGKHNVVFMWSPGVGKTHLTIALGLEAIKKEYNMIFTHTNSLINQLHRSKADGKYQSVLLKISRIDLLIIDELGFRKIPQNGMDDFFEIIRSRYETGSVIITTNRNFEDWDCIAKQNNHPALKYLRKRGGVFILLVPLHH